MAGRGLGNQWGPPVFFLKIGGWDAKHEIWGPPNFYTENWGLVSFRYHKKTIVIIMILTKEVENFLGSPICVQHSEVLWLPFEKTFTLDLKVDLNQSAEVGSLRKPAPLTPTRITWDPFDILNILKCTYALK